jgi:hypothetical protein
MRLDYLCTKAATAIQKSLDEYEVAQWGFFEWRDMGHVYDSLAWTMIQDAETLDGAGIVETSRRFREWIEGPGRQEMQGSVFAREESPYWPRYCYALHVDEESLESVVDDTKARKPAGYLCKLVREDNVALNLAAEEEREENLEEDEDELLDLRK